MEIKLENLLSVGVTRVVSRKADVSNFISTEEYNQYFNNYKTLENISLPEKYKNDYLVVPAQYLNIYLGEVVFFYINCTNNSVQDAMTDVSVRIDMQIENKAKSLLELKTEKLEAKSTLDTILNYEITKGQIHVLICTLGFNIDGYERQTCRKFYNFQVVSPIDVKSKSLFTTEHEEIYLETLLQNLANLPIQLKSVTLESANYDVTSLNYVPNDTKQRWIFGDDNRLNPNESRQYLFILKPKKEIRFNLSVLKSISTIGNLDMIWVSAIGQKGHIQTSQFEKKIKSCNKIEILIEEAPTQVPLKSIFKIKLRLLNCNDKPIEPILNFINSEDENILWLGLSTKNLGELKESQSVEFEMNLYPIKAGMYSIPEIKVNDLISKKNYEYKLLAFVDII